VYAYFQEATEVFEAECVWLHAGCVCAPARQCGHMGHSPERALKRGQAVEARSVGHAQAL